MGSRGAVEGGTGRSGAWRRILLIAVMVLGVLLLGAAGFAAYSYASMRSMVDAEVSALVSGAGDSSPKVFSAEMLEGLPVPVQRYFRLVMKDGQPFIRLAAFDASGDFRLPRSDSWTQFDVREHLAADRPGFIFQAHMQKNPYMWTTLRDKYQDGKGGMYVNAFSVINILNVLDEKEMNHTCFLRWAGEAVLFPTSLLPGEHVKWEPIDDSSARAILTDGAIKSELIFHFNEAGEITHYESDERYDIIGGKYMRVGSVAYRRDYREVNGVKIPTKFSIVRVYPDGTREEFWKGEISNVKYDAFAPE
jgi:hypothetical protein